MPWLRPGSKLMSVSDARIVSVPPLVGVTDPAVCAERSLAPHALNAATAVVAPAPSRKPRRDNDEMEYVLVPMTFIFLVSRFQWCVM